MARDTEVGREMHAGSEVGEVEGAEIVVMGDRVPDQFTDYTERLVVDADGREIGELSRCTGDVCIITPTPGVWERLTEKYGTERLSVDAEDLVPSGDNLALSWTLDEVLAMEYEGEADVGEEGVTEPRYGDETLNE